MEGVNGKRHAASDETYVLPLPESENSEDITDDDEDNPHNPTLFRCRGAACGGLRLQGEFSLFGRRQDQ